MTENPQYRTIEELTPVHWKSEYVEANGIRQHYIRTGGDKAPMLLLHGFQMDGLTWLRLAKRLEGEYDLIMPDARGHGLTGSADAGVTPPVLVEDVAALIQALGLEQPALIGHSMGADTAGRLALRHPELIRAVVLVDPALQSVNPSRWMESEGYRAWYQGWLAYTEALRTQSHEERMAATLARQTPGISPANEEDFVTHIEALRRLDMNILAQVWTMNEGVSPLGDVLAEAVAVPKLLMLAQPPATGYGLGNRTAERDARVSRWQKGTALLFEETGHFIHSERMDEFMEEVQEFLATTERRN